MTVEIAFKCGICGQAYKTGEAAERCEMAHTRPTRILDRQIYTAGAKYPDAIQVEMSDGRIAVYNRKIIP